MKAVLLCGIATCTLLCGGVAHAQNAPADLVVTGARVYTVDNAKPVASAVAVRGDRIVFVGSDGEAAALIGRSTTVVRAAGRIVIPGMVDAHAHLLNLGFSLRRVQLRDTRSYDEVIQRVVARARTAAPGEWISGRGWDQTRWQNTAFPTHEALSRAVPANPVVLDRIDGHAILANAAAMRAAGITRNTPDPPGGRILRLPNGEPSGVFIDNAEQLIQRRVPPSTRAQARQATLDAIAEANRWGLTGVHEAGASRRTIEMYEELARARRFDLRNYVMIADDTAALRHYFALGPRSNLYGGRIWVRAVKLYADGALGSRGAALLAPYSDDPGNSGLLVSPPAHIRSVAERGLRRGFQINVHAIGDRGARVVLDAFESALRAFPVANHRFRMEHAQVLAPADIPRFAALGVIPSMQGSHQTSDMRWAEQRLGPQRIRGAYAWRSLLNTGVTVPNGSDFPVEEVNPLISFYAAVTRQDASGSPPGGWYPDQVMTREEALRSMTIWPAYAAFQENYMGSLTTGKYADFVILDRDIMRIPVREILQTRVLATYLGGRKVYELK